MEEKSKLRVYTLLEKLIVFMYEGINVYEYQRVVC